MSHQFLYKALNEYNFPSGFHVPNGRFLSNLNPPTVASPKQDLQEPNWEAGLDYSCKAGDYVRAYSEQHHRLNGNPAYGQDRSALLMVRSPIHRLNNDLANILYTKKIAQAENQPRLIRVAPAAERSV